MKRVCNKRRAMHVAVGKSIVWIYQGQYVLVAMTMIKTAIVVAVNFYQKCYRGASPTAPIFTCCTLPHRFTITVPLIVHSLPCSRSIISHTAMFSKCGTSEYERPSHPLIKIFNAYVNTQQLPGCHKGRCALTKHDHDPTLHHGTDENM